jgi:pimeloyl-ACP methyl ester carboxylesterase
LIGPIALFGLPARLIVRYVLISAFFDPAKIDRSAIDAYAVNLQSAGHRHALIETAKALIPSDFNATQQHYATIDVPTLLIWGQQDRIVPPMVGVGLNAVLPRSDLFFIDRCGHMPQEERPDIVNKRVAEFLGD